MSAPDARPSPPLSVPPRTSGRRGAARVGSGEALLGAFAATLTLLRWLLAGLIAIYLCSGITRVAPHEDALIYRLGSLQREVHPSGLLFALPPPFDRVVKVPTRTQHEVFLNSWSPDENNAVLGAGGIAQTPSSAPAGRLKGLHPVFDGYTLTGDANIVQARLSVRFRIVDPLAYAAAAQPVAAPALIESALYTAATRTLAEMKIDDALGSGLESLRHHVLTLAQQRLDTLRLGVELVAFEVSALTPPAATVAAFSDVTSAQVESRTMVEQSRTYCAQLLPKAQSDAYRLHQQADAEARQLTVRAGAEAASFLALLAEHRAAPTVVETRLRAEALEEILPRVKTKTVLPATGGQLNLFLRENK